RPASAAARMTRTAISPRFAMSTLLIPTSDPSRAVSARECIGRSVAEVVHRAPAGDVVPVYARDHDGASRPASARAPAVPPPAIPPPVCSPGPGVRAAARGHPVPPFPAHAATPLVEGAVAGGRGAGRLRG